MNRKLFVILALGCMAKVIAVTAPIVVSRQADNQLVQRTQTMQRTANGNGSMNGDAMMGNSSMMCRDGMMGAGMMICELSSSFLPITSRFVAP